MRFLSRLVWSFVALEDTIVFFYSPTDIAEKRLEAGTRFRLGGLVAEGSIERDGDLIKFRGHRHRD